MRLLSVHERVGMDELLFSMIIDNEWADECDTAVKWEAHSGRLVGMISAPVLEVLSLPTFDSTSDLDTVDVLETQGSTNCIGLLYVGIMLYLGITAGLVTLRTACQNPITLGYCQNL